MRKVIILIFGILCLTIGLATAQEHGHDHNHDGHDHGAATHDDQGHDPHANSHDEDHGTVGCEACDAHHDSEFDPGGTAFHHISDANVYSIGPFNIPLPCILYAPETGWSFFMSSKFGIGHHGTGHKIVDGYVLDGGSVKRIQDASFPKGTSEIKGCIINDHGHSSLCHDNKVYDLDAKSTADGGLFGGGITSYYDFSITKNVAAMLIVTFFLLFMFRTIANGYKKRDGMAPKGLQSLIEPVIVFLRDEVAKPFLGHKWEKFFPFLLTIFFFILALNLFGQIPFFGGANVTGNLAVTMVLAICAFVITNINGNAHYWQHIFWMPGIPAWVKVIITPVEMLGVIIKPITLMLRLFANITAGHMVMIIFVGLIFVFGQSGANAPASYGTAVASTLLTLFMMAIELLVAFIQAFVFTILTASYIGAATEEAHH